jgi:hypothetical protein
MHLGHAQYLPVAPPMFALLAGALGLLLILIQIRVLRFASSKRLARSFLLELPIGAWFLLMML